VTYSDLILPHDKEETAKTKRTFALSTVEAFLPICDENKFARAGEKEA
jgi:hypothetical protein